MAPWLGSPTVVSIRSSWSASVGPLPRLTVSEAIQSWKPPSERKASIRASTASLSCWLRPTKSLAQWDVKPISSMLTFMLALPNSAPGGGWLISALGRVRAPVQVVTVGTPRAVIRTPRPPPMSRYAWWVASNT